MRKLSDKAGSLINLLGLQKEIAFYELFNDSKGLPYHNMVHVDHMLQSFVDMLIFNRASYRASDLIDEGFTLEDMQIIASAIIFHDFGHTGISRPDSKNIEIAITGYKDFLSFGGDYNTLKIPGLNGQVIGLIRGTEYPYTGSSWSSLVEVIRDLDKMCIYQFTDSPHEAASQMVGLYRELSASSQISQTKFVENNTKFLLETGWYTPFAIELKKTQLNRCLETYAQYFKQSF